MSDRVELRFLLLLALGACSLAATAQEFRTRTLPGNGRTVFELRLGGTSLPDPAALPGQGLVVAAVTGGPTSGTTSLIAATFDGRTLFDPSVPLPAFTTVVSSGSVFSLGGGCRRGADTLFPFINNGRPQLLRRAAGAFSVATPAIGNSDQYDSADCVSARDGATTYFVFTNRTDATLEFFREDANGFQPLPASTTVSDVGTPLSGGMRPAIDLEPLGTAQRLRLAYGYNAGTTTTMRTSTLDVTLSTHVDLCPFLVTTRQTAFTRPPEAAVVAMGPQSGGVTLGDYDKDGIVDLFVITPGCGVTRVAGGSSNGAGLFNWTGYGTAVGLRNGTANLLWGDYFQIGNATGYPVNAAPPGPFPGRGGPFAACAAEDAESGAEVVSAASGATPSQIELARGHRDGDRIFRSQMSREELATFCARAYYP